MRHKWLLLIALCLPATIQAVTDTIILDFTDTVTTVIYVPDSVFRQREMILPADSTERRGHYVQVQAGVGYGSLGYSLEGAPNRVNGSLSAIVQMQYAYFFHKNWGIGAGVWFTNYASMVHIGGDYRWSDQIDSDLEHYDHTASVQTWREREIIHNVGVPISLQFQYQKDYWKASLYAAIGLAPSLSVMKHYKVLEGVIDHSGYYPAWDLELTHSHEFQEKQYSNEGTLSLHPQLVCFLDLGTLIPLSKQVDLFLGGYFNMCANDANKSQKKEIGWKDDDFTFMEEYNGAYATNLASASRPWEAGLKVGIHWHHIASGERRIENYYEPFMREETITQYVDRFDTCVVEITTTTTPATTPTTTTTKPNIRPAEMNSARNAQRTVKATTPQKAKKSKVLQFKNVYFKFDSYELTQASQKYLLSIIDVLNRMSDAQIRLEGHTSLEGADWYNNRLSKRRANATRDFLVANGIDGNRIKTIGHGARIPSKEAKNSRVFNRRVEIIVIRDIYK